MILSPIGPGGAQYFAEASPIWLPWYREVGLRDQIRYSTSKYIGYLGTVSVPLAGSSPLNVKNSRMTGAIQGKVGTTEGAMVLVNLYQRTSNFSSPIATIFVDRRTVAVSNVYVDITQSAAGFTATPSVNSLAIEIVGEGQGIANDPRAFRRISIMKRANGHEEAT